MVGNTTSPFYGNQYFHICSDGTKIDWLFKDDSDFISGINRIGLCTLLSKVEIYAYTMMDNHIHILLSGTMSMCKEFIIKYKLLTGKWIRNKYGGNFDSRNFIIKAIRVSSPEYLLNVLAYIDRNIINTNYPFLPSEYPWGSARFLFKDRRHINVIPLSEMTMTEKRLRFNTHIEIPDS